VSKNAKQVMRDFLALDAKHRNDFDRMREDYDYIMRHADALPSRHPEKASRRWKALEHFVKQHGL